jgi:hypothetical protein
LGKSSVSLVILLGILFSVYCFILARAVSSRGSHFKRGYTVGNRINNLRSEEVALQTTLKDYREGRISREDLFKPVTSGRGAAVFFKGLSRENAPEGIIEADQSRSIVDIKYLRILWASFR